MIRQTFVAVDYSSKILLCLVVVARIRTQRDGLCVTVTRVGF